MNRKHRPKKTLDRRLRDLDDHLYFLKESLYKLASGDDGYLKPLAAELRLLVCNSSGTEGLLWRILNEQQVHDAVYVHLAGNLNREHPLWQGIQFIFAPVIRAGHGDPRLCPNYYSLKEIIKECEALIITGIGYTHEKLILQVAQQMGSAHEDDGVDPHLIELSETLVSNQSVLIKVLMLDADLMIEVGEKAIAWAVQQQNFIRKNRPEVIIPSEPINFVPNSNNGDFEYTFSPLAPEGTMFFLVDHPHSGWRTNSNCYQFGLITQGPLLVRTAKHTDKTMEICIDGLGESIVSTRQIIPDTDQPGIAVAFTWNGNSVNFYICGLCVDTVKYSPKI